MVMARRINRPRLSVMSDGSAELQVPGGTYRRGSTNWTDLPPKALGLRLLCDVLHGLHIRTLIMSDVRLLQSLTESDIQPTD